MNLQRLLLTLLMPLAACSSLTNSDAAPVEKSSGPMPVPSVAVEEPDTSEQLLISPPKDWERIYQINNPTTRLSDYVPEGQNAAQWETKLSIEAYSAQTLTIDPIELLLSEAREDERKCNFVQHFNIFSGYENRYETSVRLFLCGENEFAGQGEVKLAKSIRGDQYIYSVRFTKRVPPFKPGQPQFTDEEMAVWSTFLNDVTLCDDSVDHPCP